MIRRWYSLIVAVSLLGLYGCSLSTNGTYEVNTHGKEKASQTENG